MGFPKIRGTFFGGPHIKNYSILGSIFGSPYFGRLPNEATMIQKSYYLLNAHITVN